MEWVKGIEPFVAALSLERGEGRFSPDAISEKWAESTCSSVKTARACQVGSGRVVAVYSRCNDGVLEAEVGIGPATTLLLHWAESLDDPARP